MARHIQYMDIKSKVKKDLKRREQDEEWYLGCWEIDFLNSRMGYIEIDDNNEIVAILMAHGEEIDCINSGKRLKAEYRLHDGPETYTIKIGKAPDEKVDAKRRQKKRIGHGFGATLERICVIYPEGDNGGGA